MERRRNGSYYLACAIILLYVSLNCCQCDGQLSSNSPESNLHKKNLTGSRYCGNSLVRAMRLICDGFYAEPNLKRSLDEPNQINRLPHNRRHKIWKKRFNVKDTDLITLAELDTQYQLLFGSEVHQNKHLPYFVGYSTTPFKASTYVRQQNKQNRRKRMIKNENELNNRRDGLLLRNKRGIYEECCAKPCTVTYMKSYCLNNGL